MKNSYLFSGVNRWFGLLLSVLFSVVIFSCSEEVFRVYETSSIC